MKWSAKSVLVGIIVALSLALIAGPVLGATETITGKVNDDYQIVTDDGDVYELGENDKGDEVADLIGKRVQVTGAVTDDDGMMTIMVASYRILEE
jgi:hypothetical protein